MFFATLYALGHALVVFALGFAAIVLSKRLPKGIDHAMERFVGVTLLVLGVYVFYSLVKHRRDFRMRSRWMLLFAAAYRVVRWLRGHRAVQKTVVVEHAHDHAPDEPHPGGELVSAHAAALGRHAHSALGHSHGHRHVARMPDDPFMNYGRATTFAVGMIHGIGAETPTQVLIFLTVTGTGGKAAGVLLLACFIAGLLTSNTFVALASTFGFVGATKRFWLYATISVVTGVFSLGIGALFLFGKATFLPALFGG
jgi:high-affinity nickel-transport protein